MILKIARAVVPGVLVAGTAVFATVQPAAAVPPPTVCLPYVSDAAGTNNSVFRTTVRVCTPVDDPNTLVSVCDKLELLRPNGVAVLVRDTCA